MSLTQLVQQDLVQALKQKDRAASVALRSFKAALQKAAIDARADLTFEQELKVLKTELKQRQDAIAEYIAGKRQDLVAKEQFELTVLQRYQPAQLSEAELANKISAVVAASSVKDFGPLMKQAMQAVQGKADGKQVQTILKQLLAQQ